MSDPLGASVTAPNWETVALVVNGATQTPLLYRAGRLLLAESARSTDAVLPLAGEWIALQADPPISARLPTDPAGVVPIMIRASDEVISTLTPDRIRRLLTEALSGEES